MMIKTILFVLPVLSTTFEATFSSPVSYKVQYTIKYKSPEERRKLGLFPKIKKFVITDKPTESEALVSKEKINRRTLMPKLIIKNKEIESTKYYFYKEPLTRRPLMKYRKNILEPTSTQKVNYAASEHTKRMPYKDSDENSEEIQDRNHLEASDENSSETDKIKSNEKIEGIRESSEEDTFTTELASIDILEMENNRSKPDNVSAANEIITYPNTLEENEDLQEFIFMKNIVPRSVSKEEIITDSSSSDIIKRAVNVIEEENPGTTISVSKFTGREKYLTNDLNYRNINS